MEYPVLVYIRIHRYSVHTISMSKTFQRNIENFTCEHCGAHVEGNGYTNHCPQCLWSKHVDVYPGDREAACQGMMAPIDVVIDHGEYVIVHHCNVCGAQRRNKCAPEDSRQTLIDISGNKQV